METDLLASGESARRWVEKRLRHIARSLPGSPVDEHELQHLVHVILHSSLLLREVYTDERLTTILEGNAERALPPIMLEELRRNEQDALCRLRKLPEEVRAVGDQCLFDVGITGQKQIRGLSLEDIGVRSYRLASEILGRLGSDPRLQRFFERNKLWPLPIAEEITFLRQCAGRFNLHAELLQKLSLLSSDLEEALDPESEKEAGAVLFPVSSQPDTQPRVRDDIVLPGATLAPERLPDLAGPARLAGAAAPPHDSQTLSFSDTEGFRRTRDELISAYERLLLFSALDVEGMREELSRRVVGQPEAVEALCEEFALYAAGTHDPDRPASYFFVGPTGVGKNYLIETLTRWLSRHWGFDVPFLQIEGPNYTDSSDINELRGSTRGFIRSDEDGLLSEFHERSSRAPFSCVLVDEVEKAHPHLRKFFLSLMDRGTLTDNHGRTLRFSGSMLVFTSNLGYAELAAQAAPIGYTGDERRETVESAEAERGIRKALSPEFMNRLRIVRFRHLGQESIQRIFDLEFGRIAARFREVHGLDLIVCPAARAKLIEMGYSYRFGARHLATVIDRHCNVEVARKIRRDAAPDAAGHPELISWLREMRSGERVFDPEEVRGKVLQRARARLPYNRIEVDLAGDGFIYRALP